MAQGEILWFDLVRGFGFIRPDMGPRDVFVHVSALAETGITSLAPGTKVEFELVQSRDGRLAAQRIVAAVQPACGRRRRGQKRGARP